MQLTPLFHVFVTEKAQIVRTVDGCDPGEDKKVAGKVTL